MARCLLLSASLPKTMWTYAVKTAVYIRNRSFNPHTGKTLYEVFTGKKPNLSNMHIFGDSCHTYIQIKKILDPHNEQGIFVGYFSEKNDVRRVTLKIQQY